MISKGSTIDAINASRRRLRELEADAHRIRSAPLPSAAAKAQARRQIEQLAERGRPDVLGTIEAGEPIAWPLDALAVLAWLHRDALLAAVDAELDYLADDANALTAEQRAAALAEITTDRIAIKREKEALIDVLMSHVASLDEA